MQNLSGGTRFKCYPGPFSSVSYNIVFRAKISTDELAKVHQCTVRHIKAEEDLLERHSDKMAKHLQNNEGVWLSTSWLIFTLVVLAISYLAVILWAIYKR